MTRAASRARADRAETFAAEEDLEGGRCRVCHCTDRDGCSRSGCTWVGVDDTLCTACVDHQGETRAETWRRLMRTQGLSVYSIQERWPGVEIEEIDTAISSVPEDPAKRPTVPVEIKVDPALAVACPTCKAGEGEGCKNYKGKGCASHAARLKAAPVKPAADENEE